MNTITKLQAHLCHPAKAVIPGHFYKAITKPVICVDGTTLSVQASEFHYSSPRENVGPYTEVEVWRVSNTTGIEQFFDYSEEDPSAYVPIEQVVAFIDSHSGIK